MRIQLTPCSNRDLELYIDCCAVFYYYVYINWFYMIILSWLCVVLMDCFIFLWQKNDVFHKWFNIFSNILYTKHNLTP